MIHHVTDTERAQAAEIERLRAALFGLTEVLDTFGNLLETQQQQYAWGDLKAEEMIAKARAAMKEQP